MGCTASLKQQDNHPRAIGPGPDVSKKELVNYLKSSDKAVLQLQDKVKQLVDELESSDAVTLIDSVNYPEGSSSQLNMSTTSVTTLLPQASAVEVDNGETALAEQDELALDRLSEKHRTALIQLKEQVELLVKEFEMMTKSSIADDPDPEPRETEVNQQELATEPEKVETDQQREVPVLDPEPSKDDTKQQEENQILDPEPIKTESEQQCENQVIDPELSKTDIDQQEENKVLDLEFSKTEVDQQQEVPVVDSQPSNAEYNQQGENLVVDLEVGKAEVDQQHKVPVLDPVPNKAQSDEQGELIVLETTDLVESFAQPTQNRITFEELRTIITPEDQFPEIKIHNNHRRVKSHNHFHSQVKGHDHHQSQVKGHDHHHSHVKTHEKVHHRPRAMAPFSVSELQSRPACKVGVLDYMDWTICQLEQMTAKDLRKPAEAAKSRSIVHTEPVVKKRSANKIQESKSTDKTRRVKMVDLNSSPATIGAPTRGAEDLFLLLQEDTLVKDSAPPKDEVCPPDAKSSSGSLKDVKAELKGSRSRIAGLIRNIVSLITGGSLAANTTEHASTSGKEPLQEGSRLPVEEEPEKPSTSQVVEEVPGNEEKGSRSVATSTPRRRKRSRSGGEYSYETSQSLHDEAHPKSTVGTNTKPRKVKKCGNKDIQQVTRLVEKDILPKIEEQLERLREVLRQDQQHVPG